MSHYYTRWNRNLDLILNIYSDQTIIIRHKFIWIYCKCYYKKTFYSNFTCGLLIPRRMCTWSFSSHQVLFNMSFFTITCILVFSSSTSVIGMAKIVLDKDRKQKIQTSNSWRSRKPVWCYISFNQLIQKCFFNYTLITPNSISKINS